MTHLPLRLLTFAAGALCVVAGCAVVPPADAQSSSTYQNSCGNIFIEGATLVATCRRVDGSFHQTSIMLEGIENIDGQLQFTQPGQPASFQNSCRNIRVAGSTLTAICRRTDGSYEPTSLDTLGISNIDGHLRYDSSS
jgi:hypothetical protein